MFRGDTLSLTTFFFFRHWGGEDGLAAAPADRAGRGAGAGLPALQHGRRRPRRPQGLQVQQHPPHRALRGKGSSSGHGNLCSALLLKRNHESSPPLLCISLHAGGRIQISDFGLAKLLQQDQDLHTTTRVLGTFGYFDPEYALV